MRGRMQAALVAATLAVLALIFQPLAIGSSAVIALATLRNGPRQALLVALISLLGLGAFGALLFGRPLGLLAIGLGLWLPAILLGHVLRTWRSLRLTVEAAVLAGFGLVLVQYLGSADPGEIWAELLRQLLTPMLDAGSLTEESIGQIVDVVAPWMVGGVAATWTLQLAVSVFLARWLQALLYNPGGFGSEFRALRWGYCVACAVGSRRAVKRT